MKKNTKKAFTIIEVIIGIFIFSLGLVSVFMLFAQSSKMTLKSKKTIIATNLARESIELLKNVRDSNFKSYTKFNWIPNKDNEFETDNFLTGSTKHFYTIEHKIGKKYNIELKEIPYPETDSKLYLSGSIQYTYDYNSGNNKETDFYRYLILKDAKYKDNSGTEKTIPNTYKVISVVEWKKAGGGKIEIPFILADWKKL